MREMWSRLDRALFGRMPMLRDVSLSGRIFNNELQEIRGIVEESFEGSGFLTLSKIEGPHFLDLNRLPFALAHHSILHGTVAFLLEEHLSVNFPQVAKIARYHHVFIQPEYAMKQALPVAHSWGKIGDNIVREYLNNHGDPLKEILSSHEWLYPGYVFAKAHTKPLLDEKQSENPSFLGDLISYSTLSNHVARVLPESYEAFLESITSIVGEGV